MAKAARRLRIEVFVQQKQEPVREHMMSSTNNLNISITLSGSGESPAHNQVRQRHLIPRKRRAARAQVMENTNDLNTRPTVTRTKRMR